MLCFFFVLTFVITDSFDAQNPNYFFLGLGVDFV
jgi:hypothetical protein